MDTKWKGELEELQTKLEELPSNIRSLVSKLEREAEESWAQVQRQDKEFDELSKMVKEIMEGNEARKQREADYRAEIQMLRETISHHDQHVQALQTELLHRDQEVERMQQEVQRLGERLRAMEDDIQALRR